MSLRTLLLTIFALATGPVLADEQLELGKKVFLEQAQPSCTVSNAVKSGVGIMPAFGDSLSEQQISAVAKYIESVTRK